MASDSYLTVSIDAYYGSKRVLHCDDLSFPESSIVGVLGRNGAGKTTLLKCITGLFPIDGITWHQDIRLSALIETPRFRLDWSGLQHLEFQARLNAVSIDDFSGVIEQTGLSSFVSQVATYSLGQKQRLGIAKALLTNPDCLILDEPTNGLDPQGIAQIRTLIQDLHQNGLNIILSSHLLGEVEACCTHLVVIGEQTVQYAGPIEDYAKKGIHIQAMSDTDLLEFVHTQGWTYSQLSNGLLIQESISPETINQLCFEANITLSHLSKYESSLEEISSEKSMSGFQRLLSIETRLLLTVFYRISTDLLCLLRTDYTIDGTCHSGAEKVGWQTYNEIWIRNWMLLPLGYCWLSIQTFVHSREQGFIQDAIVAGYTRTEILSTKLLGLLVVSILSLIAIFLPTIPYIGNDQWIATMGGWSLTLLADSILVGWVALFSLSATSSNRVSIWVC